MKQKFSAYKLLKGAEKSRGHHWTTSSKVTQLWLETRDEKTGAGAGAGAGAASISTMMVTPHWHMEFGHSKTYPSDSLQPPWEMASASSLPPKVHMSPP